MADQSLLSDLCSICNTNKSKYCCPGCSARTCSLQCYKRHQQWAQCSGQRDPTKFVKKSQLVTPAGIDHDFNFLTSIERDMAKADKYVHNDEAASARSQPRSWTAQNQKGQVSYQHLEASGVEVIRAPRGLSRQKDNKSHRSSTKKSTGGKSIMWTVEWLDDHNRRMLTETSSTCQIASAQPFAPREQHKGKKRKLNLGNPTTTTSTSLQHATPTSENQNQPVDSIKSLELDIKVINQKRQHSPTGRRHPSPATQTHKGTKTNLAEAHSGNNRHDGSSTESMGDGRYRFFLLKPRTSSSRLVLIPITSTATIGECLYGRTVLEFPTIYVFPNPGQQLPEEFMLEEDYLRQEGDEQKEFDELIKELDPEILRRLRHDDRWDDGAQTGADVVDDKAILDVLKKDFGAEL